MAVDGGWLTVEPGEDGFDHTLPGNGWFTQFDVYPDSSIRTSLTREGTPES